MSGPATRSGARRTNRPAPPAGSVPDTGYSPDTRYGPDTGPGRPRPEPSPQPATSSTPPVPPAPSATPSSPSGPSVDTATDVVRWAAFSCFLVPVVLLWYGTSLAGATGTALGLATVTAACRVLLRRSERCARQRGGRHTRGGTPVD
jgi:hypothetical protein